MAQTKIIKVDGKIMEVRLKNNWTLEDFAKHFKCTEEEFEEALIKKFSDKAAKDMLNRMKTNQKRKQKNSKKSVVAIENISVKEEQPVVAIIVEEEQKVATIIEEQEVEKEEMIKSTITIAEIIAEFKRKETEITSKICDNEAARVSLIAENNSLKIVLQEQKAVLVKLRAQMLDSEKRVLDTIEKMKVIENSIADINSTIVEDKELLKEIQKEIEHLEKVSIFVYENGEVDVEGPADFEVLDSWNDVFRKLTANELAEDLTIKQIKTLSKIIAFVKSLENSYEITFEVDAVQQIFEKVKETYI